MDPRRFRHVYRNEAGAGGAAGAGGEGGGAGGGQGAGAAGGGEGGAGAGAAGAGAAGAGGGNGAAAGAAGGAGSALAAGAAGAGAAGGGAGAAGGAAAGAGAAGGAETGIPEKFIVKGADGQIDHAATAKKVAEGYTGLEKRLGSGEAPPQSVDGYKVNVPEALKDRIDADALAKDEGFKGFMGKLHAAGASQKVVDAAVATMLERGIAMREAMPQLQASECEATLRQIDGWKNDQEYTQQIRTAYAAGQQIFGDAFSGMEKKGYFNDPDFIKGLATIGREMQEDRGPSPESLQQLNSNLDTLMASPAYTNPNHPQHADTVAKVTALTAQIAGNRPVSSGKTMTFKSA